MSRPIYSEIRIDAPPSRVWSLITDLDAYPHWNRFTPRITLATRDLAVGAELDVDCQMTESTLLVGEREVILEVDHERRRFCMGTSRKRGRPGIRSFRWQICEPDGDARTRFVNYELFEGPLAPVVYLLYRKKLERAFADYVRTVKARAEAQPR